MNGARALLSTLIANDVTVCFANPGTSEMQFVAALDAEPRMRPVLCLFEGVATGAADGYARMAGTPACTLLHLGPGYANGAANLHNARRARSPIVNVIGDHATYHREYDAPLNSDVAALAGPNSLWVKSADTPASVAPLAAEAVAASLDGGKGPVSLILPADSAWLDVTATPVVARIPAAKPVEAARIEDAAQAIRTAKKPVLLIGGSACLAEPIAQAGRISATGVAVYTDTFVPRQPRGAGVFAPNKLPYFGEMALAELEGVDLIILVGTEAPVSFFAYPDRPSSLVPQDCETFSLTARNESSEDALARLAAALSAPQAGPTAELISPPAPAGQLTAGSVGQSIARHMPAGTVICDDAVTSSAPVFAATLSAQPHDVLGLTGGAIGIGLPLAIGAAVARPDDKVVALTGDGAAMYTVQSLWTMARENLDVTVVVFANNSYLILNVEMVRTGAGKAGPSASRLLGLGDPAINWVAMAEGHGIPAERCTTAEEFDMAFGRAMSEHGPRLIEVAI